MWHKLEQKWQEGKDTEEKINKLQSREACGGMTERVAHGGFCTRAHCCSA